MKGNTAHTRKVLIVTAYTRFHVRISSPINNFADYLGEHGTEVTVICAPGKKPDDMGSTSYRILELWDFESSIFSLFSRLMAHLRTTDYALVVSVDREPLLVLYMLSLFVTLNHVHFSLEVFCGPRRTARMKVEQFIEKRALKRSDGIIIQDEPRLKILLGDTEVDRSRVSYLPNSRRGVYTLGKKFFFHDSLGLTREKKIVLVTGSIIKEHLVHEAIKSVERWSDEFVLVVHGWIPDAEYGRHLHDVADRFPDKVYFSTSVFEAGRIGELFASVDIGLVLYEAVDDNFKYIGHAAGKIFDFMRAGVPVVVNDRTNASELVAQNKCGVVVSSYSEIGKALETVNARYAEFRAAAVNAFAGFEFDSCFPVHLVEGIGQKVLERAAH